MTNWMKDQSLNLLIHNQVALLKMPRLLTLHQSEDFQAYFQEFCETKKDFKKIIFDFSETQFLDSTGVGALINSLEIAKNKQLEWQCWSCSAELQSCFRLAGILELLKIESNSEPVHWENYKAQSFPIGKFPPSQANNVHPAYQSKIKRMIDIVVSLIGLGTTALFLVPIAILLKLENSGPIFSHQFYRGYLGKPICLWQFTTLKNNYHILNHSISLETAYKDKNPTFIANITNFLIDSGLFQLPRFWSVLKGDMSLIGSYPYTHEELSGHNLKEWQSLNVKPGMMGEWILDKPNQFKDLDEFLIANLRYQSRWSLGYDLKIMWKAITIACSKDKH